MVPHGDNATERDKVQVVYCLCTSTVPGFRRLVVLAGAEHVISVFCKDTFMMIKL